MKYSFNKDKSNMVFAQAKDINASYKDLGAVCDAIRYKSVLSAITILDGVIGGDAVRYKKHNKHMGSRHELGGKKGRYPQKCAGIIRKVLINAQANARNKGFEPDVMFVAHAAANKTLIAPRRPSKGALFTTRAYGYATARSSNLELSKIEIGISSNTNNGLSERVQGYMKKEVAAMEKLRRILERNNTKKTTSKKTAQKTEPIKENTSKKIESENKTEQEKKTPPHVVKSSDTKAVHRTEDNNKNDKKA